MYTIKYMDMSTWFPYFLNTCLAVDNHPHAQWIPGFCPRKAWLWGFKCETATWYYCMNVINYLAMYLLTRHYTPPFCCLDLVTSRGGGAYNWIMVISLPFPRCGARKGNCKGSWNYQWRLQSENAIQLSYTTTSLATSLPTHSQSLGWCIAGQ